MVASSKRESGESIVNKKSIIDPLNGDKNHRIDKNSNKIYTNMGNRVLVVR